MKTPIYPERRWVPFFAIALDGSPLWGIHVVALGGGACR